MLTCKDFLRELNEFLDDSAGQEMRAKLEQHVSECPNCFVIFDTTRLTIQVYKGLEAQQLPDDVHRRLMDAVARRCRGERPS